MDVEDLVALAVAVEALELLVGLADGDLEIAVEHQEAAAAHRIAAGHDRLRVGQPVHVRRYPLVAHDGAEFADRVEPAGRVEVVEDRLVAREALVAHDLLDQQPPASVAGGLADRYVPLGGDLAPAFVPHRFPLLSCSRSRAWKSALKLPSPKPREPWRSISSKNSVGRSPSGLVKIWSR